MFSSIYTTAYLRITDWLDRVALIIQTKHILLCCLLLMVSRNYALQVLASIELLWKNDNLGSKYEHIFYLVLSITVLNMYRRNRLDPSQKEFLFWSSKLYSFQNKNENYSVKIFYSGLPICSHVFVNHIWQVRLLHCKFWGVILGMITLNVWRSTVCTSPKDSMSCILCEITDCLLDNYILKCPNLKRNA